MPSLSLSGQSRQRQIVIIAVGGLILAGLMLFQLPRTLKMIRGGDTAPATTSQPTPAPASPVAPGTPVSPPAVPTTTPAPARLMALTRFKSKDPFAQQVNSAPVATSSSSSDTGSSAPSAAPPSEPSSEPAAFRAVEPSSGRAAAAESATIAVNGAKETVSVSKTFPKAKPVFKLVSVGDDTAKVGVARGSLKGGSQTVTLSKGEPLTLLNTVDGKRYKLELISVT
jgi:hypothetical protein